MEFDTRSRFAGGGVAIVTGHPRDTNFRLDQPDLLLTLSVSSGDFEFLHFRRTFCPVRERGFRYFCSDLQLIMKPGMNSADLNPLVTAIGGRFNGSGPGGSISTVTLLIPAGLAARVTEARGWPGVASATFSRVLCQADEPCHLRSRMESVIAFEPVAASAKDGILQAVPGDTVRARYVQPTGAIIETQYVVPPDVD